MTDLPPPITISAMQDLQNSTMADAIVPISQLGISGTTRIRPNPMKQVNVMNEQNLIDHFPDGSGGILIPDNEAFTILVDDSFTLSQPIKIGLNTTLEVMGATINLTITYTGTGAMFQNENPANLISRLLLEKIFIFSVGGQPAFDIIGSVVFRLTDVLIPVFESLGKVQSMSAIFDFGAAFDINEGITLIEPQAVQSNGFAHFRSGPASLTLITILSTANPAVTIDNATVLNSSADVVFFDPSSGATSDYTIKNTKGNFANLFVPGTDLAIVSVSDAGGNARFQASGAHGYSLGDRVVLSGFLVETNYNVTGIIGSIPTGSEFMVDGVAFTATDTGNTTLAGRDSTDVNVISENNANTPNSKSQAEGLTDTTIDLVPSISVFNDLVDDTPIAGDFVQDPATERFTVDDETGEITYIGLTPMEDATISYKATIKKSGGGGTSDAIFSLFQNAVQQTKTDTLASGYGNATLITVTYQPGLFTINPGDTFKLRANPDSADPITISGLSMVVKT